MEIGPQEVVIFEANMGRPIVTNGGLFTIGNPQCAAERLLRLVNSWNCRPVGRATRAGLARGVGVASRRSNAALLPRDSGQTCHNRYFRRNNTTAREIIVYWMTDVTTPRLPHEHHAVKWDTTSYG